MIQSFLTKMSPAEKKLFYGATVFFLVAVLDRMFWGPVSVQLKTLDERIHQEEGNIKKDLRFLAYKNRILAEQDAFSGYFVHKFNSEEEIIADFLKRIEILATEANINLIKVAPNEGQQKKGYKEYTASLDCNGQLSDLIRFLHLIDSSPELLKTVKFSINAKKSETNEVLASMTVSKILVDAGTTTTAKVNRPASLSDLGLGQEIQVELKHDKNRPTEKSPIPSPLLNEVRFSAEP